MLRMFQGRGSNWKEAWIRLTAGLCEPPRELGAGCNFGDTDAGASHYESSFYYENATAKCHFGVLLVDCQHQGLQTHECDSANRRPHWAPAATHGSHPAPAYDNTSPGTLGPCSRLSQDVILPNSRAAATAECADS